VLAPAAEDTVPPGLVTGSCVAPLLPGFRISEGSLRLRRQKGARRRVLPVAAAGAPRRVRRARRDRLTRAPARVLSASRDARPLGGGQRAARRLSRYGSPDGRGHPAGESCPSGTASRDAARRRDSDARHSQSSRSGRSRFSTRPSASTTRWALSWSGRNNSTSGSMPPRRGSCSPSQNDRPSGSGRRGTHEGAQARDRCGDEARVPLGDPRRAALAMTLTLGIDLASSPAKTAVCAIEWSDDGGIVRLLCRGVRARANAA